MEVIGGVSPGKLKIAAFPTLMLVDEGGRVVRVWEGQLSRKAEEELKAVITTDRKKLAGARAPTHSSADTSELRWGVRVLKADRALEQFQKLKKEKGQAGSGPR